MSISQLADAHVQLSLLSSSGHAGLAAELLTQRLGLTADHAAAVLEQGCGLLVARIGRPEAQAALPLLASLGMCVVVQPCETPLPEELCDVSIRVSQAKQARKLIAALGRKLDLSGMSLASFGGPEGFVLTSMPLARAKGLVAALRKLAGVSIAVSAHRNAVYDLFGEAEPTEQDNAEFRRYLRLMGCSPGGFGDALCCGLNRRMAERVQRQFPDFGLIAVNQAFQRHELLIIGKGRLNQQEFVDFLMTRPVAQSIPAQQLLQALPLPAETHLTRAAAKQFLADYSAIGMRAVTRLVRHRDAEAQIL